MDVLRFLVRRVHGMPVAILLTYRDDEPPYTHPLHQVLSVASSSVPTRRPTSTSSPTAVASLSAASGADPSEVFRVTRQPFLRQRGADVRERHPADGRRRGPGPARSARRARPPGGRAAVRHSDRDRPPDGRRAGRWGLPALAAAEDYGLVTVTPDSVAFRHSLTPPGGGGRPCGDSPSNPPSARGGRSVRDPASDGTRIVYHAAQAGDRGVVVLYGPAAARAASAAGAHRQSSGIYRVLIHGRDDEFGPAQRAEFLEQAAIECYLIGDEDRCSAGHLREAAGLRRQLGDPVALGTTLRWLSRAHYRSGDRPSAVATADEATAVCEGAGDQRLWPWRTATRRSWPCWPTTRPRRSRRRSAP